MDISKKYFGENQDSIKMIDLKLGKRYNRVIQRAEQDSYEKNIDYGWYKFFKEKKFEDKDVLSFSMNVMFVFLIKR